MSQRQYKRSWKNLLINKRYQLRFTLLMAGFAAVLMTLLGWWVTRVAGEATNVAKSRQRGRICPGLPEEAPAPTPTPTPTPTPAPPPGSGSADSGAAVQVDVGDMKLEPEPAPGSGAGTADGDADTGRRGVIMGESSLRIDPTTAPPVTPREPAVPKLTAEQRAALIAERDACERDIVREIAKIEATNRNIAFVLVGSGVLLTLGLAVFGIKMTHKVAGPLHKVTLYLAKMRDGRYDKVWDLRKGDQLVEFYEHFKHAHAGVLAMERADIARIKAALDTLEADGVLGRSPEARAAADDLRKVLDRKEASFV